MGITIHNKTKNRKAGDLMIDLDESKKNLTQMKEKLESLGDSL